MAVVLVVAGVLGLLAVCCCCKNKNNVSPDPRNEITNTSNTSVPNYSNARASRSSAENWARDNYFQAPQTQRMPEVVVPYVAGAHLQIGQANSPPARFFTSLRTPGSARATQDLAPPSYDAVIQMREMEIRQNY